MEHQISNTLKTIKANIQINNIPSTTKRLINHLNSPSVLSKLEKLTGINNLIADHRLAGCGMHRIERGGKLAIHVDYNKHPVKPLYRRINLILYLNKNWEESWGGHLELWNKDVTVLEKSVLPIYNRAIIFNCHLMLLKFPLQSGLYD